ncbi:MAG: phage tail protein [Intestinimonas sp.]|jgi:phage tail P2-like protein|nr:phage tail protein [Intestinimonas sp.]
MINLKGSRFTAIMPGNLSSQTEVQAIAYAVGQQIEKLCTCADNARTYAAIASMPENVLDLLALELRTPAYDENLSISAKRSLIEGTLTFYMTMGTPEAVNKIIQMIFGKGEIQEWFEFAGSPHHFRVVSEDMNQIIENYENFIKALNSVKRKSSVLDKIIAVYADQMNEFYGLACRTGKAYSATTDAPSVDYTILTDENGDQLYDEAGMLMLE